MHVQHHPVHGVRLGLLLQHGKLLGCGVGLKNDRSLVDETVVDGFGIPEVMKQILKPLRNPQGIGQPCAASVLTRVVHGLTPPPAMLLCRNAGLADEKKFLKKNSSALFNTLTQFF